MPDVAADLNHSIDTELDILTGFYFRYPTFLAIISQQSFSPYSSPFIVSGFGQTV